MTSRLFVLCAFVSLLIVSVGCGGGGNDAIPADVAGEWFAVANNAGSAILSGCTGDLASFNGLTVAGIASTGNCKDSGPLVMTQNDANLTALPVTYACDDGDYGSRAGGGTVNGNSLAGQLDTISGYYGVSGSELFKGSVVNSNTLALSEYRISFSGNISGSCNISPHLSLTVTIFEPLQGLTPESQHEPNSFSLARMLAAYRSKIR